MHASIAVLAMGWAMLTPHAVHALLFAVMSLISLAVSMYSLSAELAAALEVIIYAGAIMVLFIFAVMLIKPEALISKKVKFSVSNAFFGLLVLLFFGEILWAISQGFLSDANTTVTLSDIAEALFNTYGFYVEVISFVLMAGFVTAIFIAKSLNRMKRVGKT